MSTYGTSTNLRYLRQYLKYVIFILFFGYVSTYGTKKRCENNAHINLKLKINNGKRFSYSNCEVHNAQFIWYNQIIFKYQRANLPTNIHAKINIQPGLPILSLEAIVRKNFMRYQTFEQMVCEFWTAQSPASWWKIRLVSRPLVESTWPKLEAKESYLGNKARIMCHTHAGMQPLTIN